MDDNDWLAERFEAQRAHLSAVAYRMLGSRTDADDAVQEAWLHLHRADTSDVENLGGWLTTVVARVCLDMLRARRSRPAPVADPVAADRADGPDPEYEALLADSVGLALLVVLDTLAPAERLAFVLHDMFAVPFEEIAPVIDRSAVAARQLASRARRRVQGAAPAPDLARQRTVVDAFLAASREGDFAALLELLDPQVVLRADGATVAMAAHSRFAPPAFAEASRTGVPAEVRGPDAVAEVFSGKAQVVRPALVDGVPGAVWAQGGKPRVVFDFRVRDGKVVEIEMLSDPECLDALELTALD